MSMSCPSCGGYEFVDNGRHELARCPDCGPDYIRCPVHGQLVGIRDGVIVGRCWGCVNEAADAKRWLETHHHKTAA